MRKRVLIGCMAVIMGCMLAGCGSRAYNDENGVSKSINLIEINDILNYDADTKIVYYCYRDGYEGYMSPYLSKDGRYCKYENGKVVPLERGE